MAWCHQASSYYLNQYWPKSMLSFDVMRPQQINHLLPVVSIFLLSLCYSGDQASIWSDRDRMGRIRDRHQNLLQWPQWETSKQTKVQIVLTHWLLRKLKALTQYWLLGTWQTFVENMASKCIFMIDSLELCTMFLRLLSTHWGQEKMATILQTTFSIWLSCMKIVAFDANFTEICSQGFN